MRLDVAFTPALLIEPERRVCAVIDVLRATSSLATMFARGLDEAIVAPSIQEARRLAADQDGWLLCGEERGLPPKGFDHGNSPVEFNGLDLLGRRAVIATTNGTLALTGAARSPLVLAAALVNASAAARSLTSEAVNRKLDAVLVCAGNANGRAFSLEDAYCAGALVEVVGSCHSGVELSDSAAAALRLYRAYQGAGAMLADAEHARSLAQMGLEDDVAFCARRDAFDVVPALRRAEDGTLRMRAAP